MAVVEVTYDRTACMLAQSRLLDAANRLRLVPKYGYMSVPSFNDAKSTTHPMLMAVFDAAIAQAEAVERAHAATQ